MIIIKDMVYEMEEELEKAKWYYEDALALKETHPEFARKYIEIAKQELNHLAIIHDMVVAYVNKLKSEGKEMTDYMKIEYEKAHIKLIDEKMELDYKINRFSI